MKSKFFAHDWRSTISNKAYSRYLQSCLEDETISPREKDLPKERSLPREDYWDYYTSEKLRVTKYQAAEEKTFIIAERVFDSFWMKVDKLSLKITILDYLTLGDIARLTRASKSFMEMNKERIWEYLIERDLRTSFHRQKFFGSPNYAKNLYKSIHFSLLDNQILKSPLMYEHKVLRVASLAYRLLDFKEVRSMKTIERLRGYLFDNITVTLMLSFLPETSEFVVWIVDERKGKLNHFEVKTWHLERENQKTISAKFLIEDVVLVQSLTQDSNEISLISLTTEEAENHRILIEYDEGASAASDILKQDEKAIKVKGIESSEVSYSFDQKEGSIMFYNKENEKTLIFMYNLKTRKIEAAKVEDRETGFLEIFQGPSETFLIDGNLEIYTMKHLSDKMKKVSYCDASEADLETNQYMNYRYTAEYFVVVRNMDFYYIDLKAKESRKIIRFLEDLEFDPFNLLNHQESCVYVYNNNLKNWNVFEDVLVVMLENADLIVVKLDSAGQIISFSEEKALLDTFPPTEPKFEKLKSYDNMIGAQIPPIILMNHGYLVIVTFPRLETSFNVFIFSMTQNLICRDISSWRYKPDGGKQFHRTSWWIRGDDLFGGDAEEYFLSRKIMRNYSSSDIVKFEDNKLLFRVAGLNLFFDLQSSLNQRFPAPNKFVPIENKFLTFKVHLPEALIPQDKPVEDDIKLKKEKLKKNNNMPNYIKFPNGNKNHNDEENAEIHEAQKWDKKSVKQEIRDLFGTRDRFKASHAAPLSHIKGTIPLKKYYLKKLNKKKDKIKRKHQGREEEEH